MTAAPTSAAKTAATQGDPAAWQAQLSAWLDGEAGAQVGEEGTDAAPADAWDALLQDAQAHQLWQDWQMAGDVLRSPRSTQLAIQSCAAFQARLAQALHGETVQALPVGQTSAATVPVCQGGGTTRLGTWLRKIRLRTGKQGYRQGRIALMVRRGGRQGGWQGGGLALAGVAALAVAMLVWLLAPQFATYFAVQEAGDSLIVDGGELDGNLYVQAHRQFVGGNPIRQVTLEMGVAP